MSQTKYSCSLKVEVFAPQIIFGLATPLMSLTFLSVHNIVLSVTLNALIVARVQFSDFAAKVENVSMSQFFSTLGAVRVFSFGD